jgi:hypothetical protein
MTIIGLASITFDIDGARVLPCLPTSDLGSVARRVSRTATLDGGATLTDFGVSFSDQTLTIRTPVNSVITDDWIKGMVTRHALLTVSTKNGAFLGVCEVYILENGIGRLTFLVKQKLSGD